MFPRLKDGNGDAHLLIRRPGDLPIPVRTASAGKTWEKKRCNSRSKKGLLLSNVKAEMPSDTKWDLAFWSEAAVAAPVKRSVFLALLLTA
jgi:hypothetical protein